MTVAERDWETSATFRRSSESACSSIIGVGAGTSGSDSSGELLGSGGMHDNVYVLSRT